MYNWEEKRGAFFKPRIGFPFSLATLVRTRAALLHFRGTLTKEKELKISQIKLMSSSVHATSRGQILSKLRTSTSSPNVLSKIKKHK